MFDVNPLSCDLALMQIMQLPCLHVKHMCDEIIRSRTDTILILQEPSLRRVHVKTTTPLRLDPVRPEYHRATLHYTPYAREHECPMSGI